MKFPNKLITYKKSSFPKMELILKELESEDRSPSFLYEKLHKCFYTYKEFIEVITCLYALNKIVLTKLEELHLC